MLKLLDPPIERFKKGEQSIPERDPNQTEKELRREWECQCWHPMLGFTASDDEAIVRRTAAALDAEVAEQNYETLVARRMRRGRMVRSEFTEEISHDGPVVPEQVWNAETVGQYHALLSYQVRNLAELQECFASEERMMLEWEKWKLHWSDLFASIIGLDHCLGWTEDSFIQHFGGEDPFACLHRPSVPRFHGVVFSSYHDAAFKICQTRTTQLGSVPGVVTPGRARTRKDEDYARYDDYIEAGQSAARNMPAIRRERWPFLPFDAEELHRLLRIEYGWLTEKEREREIPPHWMLTGDPCPNWSPEDRAAHGLPPIEQDDNDNGDPSEPRAGDFAVVRQAIELVGSKAPIGKLKEAIKAIRKGYCMNEERFRNTVLELYRSGEYTGSKPRRG